jgi:rod shape-determining protein MreC
VSGENGTTSEVKTKVIVDGPLPAGAKKTTPPASTGTPSPQTQHASAAPTAQKKGPELVPDDGSRPPPTMQQKPKPQPQQTTPAQPQPQGGR